MNMTTPQDDGEPAQTQPQEEYMAMMREANSPETKNRNLRDWFAGMALSSMDYGWFGSSTRIREMAEESYNIADAMLAARKGDV